MKKLALVSSIILSTSLVSTGAMADMTPVKKQGLFGGGALVGALVGGPVGYLVGAATGAYIAEKGEQADHMKQSIAEQQLHIESLNSALDHESERFSHAADVINELQHQLLAEAQAPVFFDTGSDQLSAPSIVKLDATVQYLQNHPEVSVTLEGHADPRGTDGYNLVLSEVRAKNVKQYLVVNGIDESRIETQGFGIKHSSFDNNIYELERRVDVRFGGTDIGGLAMN